MRRVPRIKSVMTPFPYSVSCDATVAEAQALMASHHVRHLPVKKGSSLIGVVSERDVQFALDSQRGKGDPPLRVRDVASLDLYVVDLSTPLDEVLAHMARSHVSCALVRKGTKLVGVFTTSDACRLFGEYLRGDDDSPDDVA
ncbi:MAG TPA: CBS domain-containing protein [Candidatus Limnocylindria bacterium]|nr:CBS domain-containing protein [Candidatus Limnocylindria bacterium]